MKTSIKVTDTNSIKESLNIRNNKFLHVFKKSERISLVTYIITEHLKDEEPLKWSLRQTANKILQCGIFKSHTQMSESDMVEIQTDLARILSLYEIAYHVNFISAMNFSIIRYEILMLGNDLKGFASPDEMNVEITRNDFQIDVKTVVDREEQRTQTHQEENFYKIKTTESGPAKLINRGVSKGQENKSTVELKGHVKDMDRVKEIRDIIRARGNVNIKDISSLITNCSEKTIQRALSSMVESGDIHKEGERRWSTYSIK